MPYSNTRLVSDAIATQMFNAHASHTVCEVATGKVPAFGMASCNAVPEVKIAIFDAGRSVRARPAVLIGVVRSRRNNSQGSKLGFGVGPALCGTGEQAEEATSIPYQLGLIEILPKLISLQFDAKGRRFTRNVAAANQPNQCFFRPGQVQALTSPRHSKEGFVPCTPRTFCGFTRRS